MTETICEIKEIPYQVSVFGLPESNAPMRYGHKLQFHCSKPGMALNGTMEVSCLAGGTWSHPLPNCIGKELGFALLFFCTSVLKICL